MRDFIPLIFCVLLLGTALPPAPAQEASDEEPVRLANGVAVEGAVKKSVPEGLTMETPRGVKTLPWKYLSAGTRYRHERPMLEALAKAKLAEEAKKKAAAAKAAKKAAGTNAAPAVAPSTPKATTPAVTAPTVTVPAVPSAAKPAAPAAK